MTSTSSLRHRHAKDEHSEPLLASNASTLDREVEDPLLLPPPSPLEHHRRCHTVTNIAEVYKQVGNTLMAAAERDAASFQEDATVHDNINAVTAGAIANLCSATLGAGVLALPYALWQAGLAVGGIFMVVAATATAMSVRLLIKAVEHYGEATYEGLAERVRCRPAVEASMLIFCSGCAVAYMIAVGDILEQSGLLLFGSRTYSMLATYLLAMLPLSMLRRVQSLQFASAVGIAAIGTLIFAAFVHLMTDGNTKYQHDNSANATTFTIAQFLRIVQEGSNIHDTSAATPSVRLSSFLWPAHGVVSVLTACPVVLFAFSCQTNVCAIYEELVEPTNSDSTTITAAIFTKQDLMRRVTLIAVGICAALYSSVSVIALADFGAAVQPNMLSCYHNDSNNNTAGQIIMRVATAAMAFAVIMAFPLNIFPARVTLIGLIEKRQGRSSSLELLPTRTKFPEVTDATSKATSVVAANEDLTAALLQDSKDEQVDSNLHHVGKKANGGGLADCDAEINGLTDQLTQQQLQHHDVERSPASRGLGNGEFATGKKFHLRLHIVTTLFLTGMALSFALILPNISVVFGLLGGTASSILGFCVPGLLGIQLAKDLREETGELQLGMLVQSWSLLVGGVAVGFLTTAVTVYNILMEPSF